MVTVDTPTRAEPPKHLLVFDPGKSTGWANFMEGKLKDYGIVRGLDEFNDFLREYVIEHGTPDVILYETFHLFPNKAQRQAGSDMPASQIIGKIELWASLIGAKIEKQNSSILTIAQMWSKVKVPTNHNESHGIVALNHGIYWLVVNNYMDVQMAKD